VTSVALPSSGVFVSYFTSPEAFAVPVTRATPVAWARSCRAAAIGPIDFASARASFSQAMGSVRHAASRRKPRSVGVITPVTLARKGPRVTVVFSRSRGFPGKPEAAPSIFTSTGDFRPFSRAP
jgi:hypothetical protein